MANSRNTFFLPREEQIVITFDAFADGYVANIGNPGDAPSEFQTVSASDVVTLGPFNDPKNYEIVLKNGGYTSSAPQFLGAVDDDSGKEDHSALAAVAESGLYTDLTITPETNIATIANDADGTAIATAGNAIIAALIAKDLVASS